jgi:hypothetical protein
MSASKAYASLTEHIDVGASRRPAFRSPGRATFEEAAA